MDETQQCREREVKMEREVRETRPTDAPIFSFFLFLRFPMQAIQETSRGAFC